MIKSERESNKINMILWIFHKTQDEKVNRVVYLFIWYKLGQKTSTNAGIELGTFCIEDRHLTGWAN